MAGGEASVGERSDDTQVRMSKAEALEELRVLWGESRRENWPAEQRQDQRSRGRGERRADRPHALSLPKTTRGSARGPDIVAGTAAIDLGVQLDLRNPFSRHYINIPKQTLQVFKTVFK